jgi:FixJ family two-component response regulator
MCGQRSVPTIAVVVDDEALAQALRFMLISEGYQAEACADWRQVLALALPAKRVCLIVDERLRDGSGVDALRALRADGVMAPAILIATAPDAELRRAARANGARIVEKPLVGDALLGAVRALTRT